MGETFTFGGVNCQNYNVVAFEGDTFGGSARSYEPLVIQGRDGNILVDNKRRGNVEMTYNCIIYKNAETNLDGFRNAILSKTGYNRLEDSIHPLEFYQAAIVTDFRATFDRERERAKFTVTFSRKPQRFLKSGETTMTFSSAGSIYNPTDFPSRPLLRVYGSGSVTVGGTTITITGVSSSTYVDIDCEIMEAYRGATNLNKNVSFSTNDFPTLAPGSNGLSKSGVGNVIVTPRWFKV